MLHARLAALLCCMLIGCSSWNQRVFKSVKERLDRGTKSESASADGSTKGPDGDSAAGAGNDVVQTASGADPANKPGELAESIVARVNGEPILAQDLFAPLRPALVKAQQELSPADFAKFRNQAIQRQLRDLIERRLIIQEAKKQLPEPAIKRLETMADKEFGKRIESEMKRMEVNTEAELRRKLLENNESLDQMRDANRELFTARQFLMMQLQPRLTVSREEMLEYYNSHLDQYKKDGGVRWSEILVGFSRHGSREAARARADQIVQQLRAGADFADLAGKESDGATAAQGGRWELTTPGSYIVEAVDQAIFKLPVRQVSDPIEGPQGWHIVRVDERIASGASSFVDVQDEIRRAVRDDKSVKESQQYVQELARKAHLTTIFDRPNPSGQPTANPTTKAQVVKLGNPLLE